MREEIVEFFGTFFLVLTIGMVVIDPGAGALAPLAIGMVLIVMVYMGGPISGGHYNPAVSLAVWLRGKIPARKLLSYALSQGLAGLSAALVVGYLKGGPRVTAMDMRVLPALLAEFLFTTALCLVVLLTATDESRSGNSYFGLAIGGTVLAGAYAVGAVSGAAFNPAVALGITVMGLSLPARLWVFLLPHLLGAAAAAGLFRAVTATGD